MDSFERYRTAYDRFEQAPDGTQTTDALYDMIDAIASQIPVATKLETTLETTTNSPHFHARHLIKKLASGEYQYETSVSVDADDLREIAAKLEELNRIADGLARLECGRRKELDAWRSDSDAQLDSALAAAAKDGAR